MTMTMTGKEIKRIRKGLNMKQNDFAEALDVSQGSISRWEKETASVPKKHQEKILSLMQHTPDAVKVKVEDEIKDGSKKKRATSTIKIKDYTLGKRIKMIRTSLKMSQFELAEHTGVSIPSVSHWETGRFCPSDHCLNRIGALVNIHANELKFGSLEEFVFEYVGNAKYTLFPKASHNDVFEIIELLSQEERPYEMSRLISVVRYYRSDKKSSSILPGYFTTLVSA